jgi:S-formylglutathione hydrolase
MTELIEVEHHRSFGGKQGVYRHLPQTTGGTMTFAVFVPPQAQHGARLPVLTYLSGLTCTHSNVMGKGGYQHIAAELCLIVVCPDTSPRGDGIPDDPAYDFGQGAGLYVDADEAPWKTQFRMYSYIVREPPTLVAEHFPGDLGRQGVFGHSMGGHGALTLALRSITNTKGRSGSAFAAPTASKKAPSASLRPPVPSGRQPRTNSGGLILVAGEAVGPPGPARVR